MGTSIGPTGHDNLLSALLQIERRQQVTANNLANVSTPGFKAERTFASLLADGSTPVAESATDLRVGPIAETGNAFDLALAGEGFFVVGAPAGERLTRAGSFHAGRDGVLSTAEGYAVLGEADPRGTTRGPIVIPREATDVTIASDGAVTADGRIVGVLRIEQPAPDARLTHEQGGRFAVAGSIVPLVGAARTVRQGALEESNVAPIDAMVEMIDVQRLYASAQKALSSLDAARGIAISEIARPA